MPTVLRPTAGAGVRLPALAARSARCWQTDHSPAIPDLPITGVTLRAQDVLPGDLFAALPGSTTHGARYAGDAIERGAVAVLTDAAGCRRNGRPRAALPCRHWCIRRRAACSAAWRRRFTGVRPSG